jgi:uncharacterized protein YybS (DUF2232 family)
VLSLVISTLVGLIILSGSGIIFFNRSWKALYAFVPLTLVAGFAAVYSGGEVNDFLTVVVSPVFIGAVGGLSLRFKKALHFYIVISAFTVSLIFSANYYYLKLYKNVDQVLDSKNRIVQIVTTSEMQDPDKKELLSQIENSVEIMKDIVPFTYFLNSVIISLFCFYILKLLLNKYLNVGVPAANGIEFFKLNDYFIFALIAGWLLVLVTDKTKYYYLHTAGLNLGLAFSVLYFMQSIGIIKYYLNKKGLPHFILPLSFAVILILGVEAVLFFIVILSSVGALDFWADFRKFEIQIKK